MGSRPSSAANLLRHLRRLSGPLWAFFSQLFRLTLLPSNLRAFAHAVLSARHGPLSASNLLYLVNCTSTFGSWVKHDF